MGTEPDATPLSDTLFSRNRKAVLGLLYGHPDQEFYLRQIARVSGGGHGAIQRELKLLSQAGILRRVVRHRQVYFQANPECPIFEEIKAIVVKTSGAVEVLRTALAPISDRIRIAFVFGSVARGQQRCDSDVDLIIVGNVVFRETVDALALAQTQLQREVNPTVYSVEEFRSKVSSRHHFLDRVLKKEKLFLIGDERELERLAE